MLWHSCEGEVFFMMPLNFQAQLNFLTRKTSVASTAGKSTGAIMVPTDRSEHTMIM